MLTSFASLQQSKITRFAESFSDAVSVFDAGISLEPGGTIVPTKTMVVDRQDIIASLFEKVKTIGRQHGLETTNIRRDKRGVILTLTDQMLFASAEAALSKPSHALLEKIGRIIKILDVQVEIEGHTDDQPISSAAFPSNWDLSTARAINVLRHLIDACGVKSERLSAVGLSEYHPVVPNTDAANRAANRRVEIIFRTEKM
jgi:chemotaxis protein MotB